jgi:VIT1/CCC1 family predicted Fe2+/Mn2+ transporter
MFEKFKTYSKITNLWSIARRYFVNNFYDGMLTVLGILLGFFTLILKEGEVSVASHLVILTGMGTSISMFISGISGSYLSERAEQKKVKEELDRAMLISEENEVNEQIDVQEIEDAMLIHINNKIETNKKQIVKKRRRKKKTLQEKAESFAILVVSVVNGLSPFLGGIVPLIPFFYSQIANLPIFLISFLIILFCIILLGVFLGVVSKESILKNVIQMVFAFSLTLLISIFLLS